MKYVKSAKEHMKEVILKTYEIIPGLDGVWISKTP